MATIDLGRIKFKWQGAYNGATAYVVDDVVESGGSAYVCIAATTGNTPPNATYWELMASKGTDTSVLTTQGDILYHDGTSLARLGAGTSGQYLETQGSGANPQWSTVASDVVKIAQSTPSGVTSVSFDNVFTTGTYKSYIIVGSQIGLNAQEWLKFNFRNSGSDYTSANYYWALDGVYRSSSTASSTIYGGWGDTFAPVIYWGLQSGSVVNFEIKIGNPSDGTKFKTGNSTAAYHNSSSEQHQDDCSFMVNQTNTFDGFKIFSSGGTNFTTGSITVYGFK